MHEQQQQQLLKQQQQTHSQQQQRHEDYQREKQQQLQNRTLHAEKRQLEAAQRPQSTLSSSEGSDSGCSFGGISPVNFAWPPNANAYISSHYGNCNSQLTIPCLIKKAKNADFYIGGSSNLSKCDESSIEKCTAFHQQQLLQQQNNKKQGDETFLNEIENQAQIKPNLTSHAYLQQQQKQQLRRHQQQDQLAEWSAEKRQTSLSSVEQHFTSPLVRFQSSYPISAKTSTATATTLLDAHSAAPFHLLHPASATFSDITQYINPEIHNICSAGLNPADLKASALMNNVTKPTQQEMYKTVMCQAWLESTKCLFGENCKFAHGEVELRPARITNRNNTKYKTKLCEKYTTNGICPYGDRCLFIHPASSNPVTENRHFANPSFVNPEIHQRQNSQPNLPILTVGCGGVDADEMNDSEARLKSATHFELPNVLQSGEYNNACKKPFFKSQSSYFAPIQKSIVNYNQRLSTNAMMPTNPPTNDCQEPIFKKHSSASCTDTNSFNCQFGFANSKHHSMRSVNENMLTNSDMAEDELRVQNLWCEKLNNSHENDCEVLMRDEARHNTKTLQKQRYNNQASFFEAKLRERSHTQNENSFQMFAPASLSSNSMMAISEKFAAKPASILRRLNSANVIDSVQNSFLHNHKSSSKNQPASEAHAEILRDSSPQSYFNSSVALGRTESAIWSSKSSRFVMGGDCSGQNSTAPSANFFDEYSDFFMDEKTPATSIFNQLHHNDNDNINFEQVYNALNSHSTHRGKDNSEKHSNNLHSSSLTPASSSASSSTSLSISGRAGADDYSELHELMRELELQKLEEYLIASEQKLTLERSQNEFQNLDSFHSFMS